MESAKIYTYSILFSTSEEFKDKVPYICAILEKSNGERFASLVNGYEAGKEVKIGQEVTCKGQDADGKAVYSI